MSSEQNKNYSFILDLLNIVLRILLPIFLVSVVSLVMYTHFALSTGVEDVRDDLMTVILTKAEEIRKNTD